MKKAVVLTFLKVIALSCLVAFVGGCASRPPSYEKVELHMPRLKAGYARVVFYCNQPGNFAREHYFICYLDDAEVGHVSTRQFLFVDHPAGRVEIKSKTTTNPLLPARHFSLDLEPGDVRYVQLNMKFTYPADIQLGVVDAEKGEAGVKTCSYAGRPLSTYSAR